VFWTMNKEDATMKKLGIRRLDATSSHLVKIKLGKNHTRDGIRHEDSVGLSVCKVNISASRWRFYTLTVLPYRNIGQQQRA
jgi:hypothetical protein